MKGIIYYTDNSLDDEITKRAKEQILKCDLPIVSLVHDLSTDVSAQKHKKYIWPVRAYDIPLWGKSKKLVKKFV